MHFIRLLIFPVYLFIFNCNFLHGFVCDSTDQLLAKVQVSSWHSPTTDDYKKLEAYIENFYDVNKSELFPLFQQKRFQLLRNFKFVEGESQVPPKLECICFGEEEAEKDECIICYASCSSVKNYSLGVERLINLLKKTGYRGHLLYRIGGWPDIHKGSLIYFNVPYSFKAFLFDEVRDFGYKKVLWLDASMCPNKSLEPIFERIREAGIVLSTDNQVFSRTISSYVIQGMRLTPDEVKNTRRFASGVIGLNFEMDMPNSFLDSWLEAIALRTPFYSHYPEEAVLSVILYRLKVENCDFSRELYDGKNPVLIIRRLGDIPSGQK